MSLPVEEHEATIERLQEELHDVYESSPLPPEPTNLDALDDYVIRVRLAMGWP